MKKNILLFVIILFLQNCHYTNIKLINFADTISELRSKEETDLKEILMVKHVYKLKNGMVIDQYKDHYGYWYRVRRGDSLFRISKRTGCSINTLASVNGLGRKAQLKYKAFMFIPLSKRYLIQSAEIINVPIKKGQFMWPLYGRITSGFGLRHWGWRKKFHKGIDIAAPVGTKIMCTGDGEVAYARRKKDYGYVIIVKHDTKFESRYAHLQKILVAEGDKVRQGQIIGLVGKTGRATGYHLHFEIRIDDYPVNPVDYLPGKISDVAGMYYDE